MPASQSPATTSVDATNAKGAFERRPAVFRSKITQEPTATYRAAAGRYVLYVSYACPWACRCLAVIAMKGLEDAIKVVVVKPVWERTRPGEDGDHHRGWILEAGSDPVFGASTVREIYDAATPEDAEPTQVFSVPVLLDTETRTIVNNESSEIMRMFNSEFNQFAKNPTVDLYPSEARDMIDRMNHSIYNSINNGVYRCGFARSQEAYDEAAKELFERLDVLENLLKTQRFLVAGTKAPTEADIRLFVTLIRFDEVYVVYFKTNRNMIIDFPNLHGWLRELWQWDGGGLQKTVHMDHIKMHYYRSHPQLNVHAIIPVGPNALSKLVDPAGREHVPFGVALF